MLISPFTPLIFHRVHGDGIRSRYTQTFARTDVILLECLCSPSETPDFRIERDGAQRHLELSAWQINDNTVLYFCDITGLEDGVFTVKETTLGVESMPFIVTDDADTLKDTVLLQYSMDSNRRRDDALFYIDGMHRFFDFRVHGGFKDSDWIFAVDNEQFTTQKGDIVSLYAYDSVKKRFTMGAADGVPVDLAELLNRLLTCTYVYLDGVRYERSEQSVPEPTAVHEGIDSFVYKVTLQKTMHLKPEIENSNLACIRRDFSTENYRAANLDSTDYNLLIR